jgi:hypothetical protein
VTIIVSVKINDGIVLAADSAGTMNSGTSIRMQTRSRTSATVCRLPRCLPARAVSGMSRWKRC